MNKPKFVIVVGTSAGGMNALSEFAGQLKTGMDTAVFIVMHLSRTSISDFLMHRLQPLTQLQCEIATEGGSIKKDHIYIASPNLHLLLKKGSIILGRGPEENRWRTSGGGHQLMYCFVLPQRLTAQG
jgi:two-component system, chemotaxis family, protein-glutamate methylesterase/glutaminase